MNLPNALTVGRIAVTPAIALLPLLPSWQWRLAAFVLYIIAAVTDYYDGMLARSRNLITSLGQLLDPLADKLLLVATFVPMYLLMHAPAAVDCAPGAPGADCTLPDLRFATPFGAVGLPLWVVLVVVGREAFMTIFRQAAARRGVIIAAMGPAKWKTGFQQTWVGAAFFWFFAATLAVARGWSAERDAAWRLFAQFNGIVGTLTMGVAVLLTLYSLWIYLRRYGGLFFGAKAGAR